jgi:hypothetical protein
MTWTPADLAGRSAASDDDARRIDGGIRLAERRNHAFATSFGWSEVDEEHLIVAVVDQFTQDVPALREVDGRELAFEDRVLQVVPEIAHGLEDLAEALAVVNVVADEVGGSHWGGTLRLIAPRKGPIRSARRSRA